MSPASATIHFSLMFHKGSASSTPNLVPVGLQGLEDLDLDSFLSPVLAVDLTCLILDRESLEKFVLDLQVQL